MTENTIIEGSAFMHSSQEKYFAHIGNIVKNARKARGEKSTTLALSIGVTHPVISLIENGKYRSLKFVTIIDLFEHLQIPMSQLPVAS